MRKAFHGTHRRSGSTWNPLYDERQLRFACGSEMTGKGLTRSMLMETATPGTKFAWHARKKTRQADGVSGRSGGIASAQS